MNQRVKVIGIGNILCQDDGLGVRAIKMLKQEVSEENILFVSGETDAWYCLEEALDADFVIIIDAAHGGEEPGSIYSVDLAELVSDRCRLSCHDSGLLDLIYLYRLGDEKINGVLLGMEPGMLGAGLGLSPIVENNLPRLVNEVKKIIRRLN